MMAKFLCIATSEDYYVYMSNVIVINAKNKEEAEVKAREHGSLFPSDDIDVYPFNELKVGWSYIDKTRKM
jgi:hypothetical protein